MNRRYFLTGILSAAVVATTAYFRVHPVPVLFNPAARQSPLSPIAAHPLVKTIGLQYRETFPRRRVWFPHPHSTDTDYSYIQLQNGARDDSKNEKFLTVNQWIVPETSAHMAAYLTS